MGRAGRSRWGRVIGRGALAVALLELGAGTGRPATAGPRTAAAAPPVVITWLRAAPASPRRVYVGGFAVRNYVPGTDASLSGPTCGFRISRSADAGMTWLQADPVDLPYDTRLGCYGPGPLTMSPDGTHLFYLTEGYLASADYGGAGLRSSADGGATWLSPTEQAVPDLEHWSDWGAAISPVDARRVWAFVEDYTSQISLHKLLRSDDGGAHFHVTWPPAGAAPTGGPPGGPATTPVPGGPIGAPAVGMVADPTRADTAYVGLQTSETLPPPQAWARTEDGGRSWQPVRLPVAIPPGGTGAPYAAALELYLDPHLPGLLALRVAGSPAPPGLPPDRRYVSADHGRTWRAVSCPGDLRGACPAYTLDNVFGAGRAYGFYADGLHAFAGAGPAGPRLALSDRLPCHGAAVLDAAGGMRAGDPAYLLCQLSDDRRARLAALLPPSTFKFSDPGRVGAAYRSTDGGRSWRPLTPAAGW